MALKIVKGNLLMMAVKMSSFMSLQMHKLMSFELHKWCKLLFLLLKMLARRPCKGALLKLRL